MTAEILIPERFFRAVSVHLIKNYAPEITDAPLILAIHGPPGEGKTFQVDTVLEQCGVRSFRLSGGQFEDPESGEPARRLRREYRTAGRWMQETGDLAVVLINDIDTGIGDFGELVQYTVNRQTVSGELMSLTDHPEKLDGCDVPRVPLILTANDLTKLYRPLVRLGRMVSFYWEPTGSERASIVQGVFPELSEADVQRLLKKFRGESIAFFGHIRSALVDDRVWQCLQADGFATVAGRAMMGELGNGYVPTVDSLLRTGGEMKSAQHLMANYVDGPA